MIPVSDWRYDAACAGMNTELFYPESSKESAENMKILGPMCKKCPVRQQCLDHALWYPERFGIWAGMLSGERKLLRDKIVRKRSGYTW